MISKESIMFASNIYDAYLKGKYPVRPLKGSLIELTLNENLIGLNLTKEFDPSIENETDYIHGLQFDGSLKGDTIEDSIEDSHDSIIHDYSNAISDKIIDGILYTKKVVVPELKELYLRMHDIYSKEVSASAAGNYVTISPMVIPSVVLETGPVEFDTDELLDNIGDIRAMFDALQSDNNNLYSDLMLKGFQLIGYDHTKDSSLISNPAVAVQTLVEERKVPFCNLYIVLGILAAIKANPRINTGFTSIRNLELVDIVYRFALSANNYELEKIRKDVRERKIIHCEYDTTLMVRSNRENHVYVYSDILDELRAKYSEEQIKNILIGSIATNDRSIDYRNLAITSLYPEVISRLTEYAVRYMKTIIDYSVKTTRDRLVSPLADILNDYDNYDGGDGKVYFDHQSVVKEVFSQFEDDDIDEAIYKVAKMCISLKYASAKNIITIVDSFDDDEEGSDTVIFTVISKLICSHLLEQIQLY